MQKTSEDIELRKAEAWQVAREAALLLRKKYDAKKILVFGSLASDEAFNAWSDIDLAVLGVTPNLFYSAVATITGLSSNFRIDLIDLEDCRPGIKKIIDQEGIEL
jgi:predicted nucleotidyltransferase